jgi:hypothetical protein
MTDLGTNRKNSQNIAPAAKGQGGGERPAARWQDKSREVRGGRSGEEGAISKHFVRCALSRDSLSVRASRCKHTHDRTSHVCTQ